MGNGMLVLDFFLLSFLGNLVTNSIYLDIFPGVCGTTVCEEYCQHLAVSSVLAVLVDTAVWCFMCVPC